VHENQHVQKNGIAIMVIEPEQVPDNKGVCSNLGLPHSMRMDRSPHDFQPMSPHNMKLHQLRNNPMPSPAS
jgi:hypothetical protein